MFAPAFSKLVLLAAVGAGSGPAFSGVVRLDGRVVPRAEVWLIGATEKDWQPELARTRSDDQGRFTLPEHPDARSVVARDDRGRLGWLSLPTWSDLTGEPALRVDLHDTAPARGRLLGPDGQPLRGRIRVYLLLPPGSPEPDRSPDYLSAPAALARDLETTLADDGSFVLPAVPVGGKLTAAVTAAGYEHLQVSWGQDRPLDLRLEKPGTARLRFTGAADPKQLDGLTFRLGRKGASDDEPAPSISVWAAVKVGPEGTLRLTGLYPGDYELNPEPTGDVPVAAEEPATFRVKPGEETEVAVTVKPLARVQGQVTDRTTGKGIPGVAVSVTSVTNQRQVLFHGQVRTDADGRFRAYVRPGKLGLAIYRPPAGYLRPRDEFRDLHTVEAGGSATFVPFPLDPAVPVQGIVQDAEGRPVPGVRVWTAHDAPFDREKVWTDAAGRFTLRDLGPKDLTALRARTPTAVTGGAVAVDVAQQKGPVKLVVTEANAFRLRGRVLDNAGRPVADAAVRVEWRYRAAGVNARYGYGAWLETYRTDADGRFETQALWPGDDYKVQVTAAGHGKAESAEVHGEAGKRHDLGTITLRRTAGTIAGVVVDAAGKPVAGAAVFNEGDGPTPVKATTDAAGRFKLQGLFDGPVLVFVRKPGYRFSMARGRSGDATLTVQLLKAGESAPAAEQPDPRPPAYAAAEAKLTRHLLERLWALPRSVTGGHERRVFERMAALDLAEAKKWLAEEAKRDPAGAGPNSYLSRVVRVAEAEKAAAEDADEALALLAPLGPDHGFEALLHLAGRHEKDDPAKALRFVEEAVVKARALKLPDRAWSLAEAGGLAVRLGKADAGRKLLTEAADLADHFGAEQMQGYGRGKVAALLAPFDLPRSRALLKGFTDPGTWNRYLADVAVRRAATDSREALALLDELRPDNSFVRDETRLRIAYVLAEKDPAEAVKQAGAITELRYRATALSGIAALVGRRDPGRARALIDRTLDLYLDQPDPFRGWGISGGRTGLAAWTAYHARLAGYPDMASVVARVLATRPTLATSYSPGDVTDMLLHTAIVLSLSDPATARLVLEQALPAGRPVAPGRQERRTELFAVALADPERAGALVDQRIDQARTSPDGLSGSDLVELMLTLTAPSDRLRVRELNSWIGHSWTPGTED